MRNYRVGIFLLVTCPQKSPSKPTILGFFLTDKEILVFTVPGIVGAAARPDTNTPCPFDYWQCEFSLFLTWRKYELSIITWRNTYGLAV